MKKILLSFMLMAICYLAFPGMTVSAAGSLWNRVMSGSVQYNDDPEGSLYGNSVDFIISSIDVDTDDWGVFAYGSSSNELYLVILSTHPFSVTYSFQAYGAKEFTSKSKSSSEYHGLYRGSIAGGGNGFIHYMRSVEVPVFNGSLDDLIEALKNQDTSGFVSMPLHNVFDVDTIDIPRIELVGDDTDGGSKFAFSNGAENLFVQIKGRWWSVDDIELYKESAVWKYRYSSRIHSDLTDWVSIEDSAVSTLTFSFTEIGQTAFNVFLEQYPVSERTYTGGTNVLGNFFSGYNDALEMLQKMLLSNMCTAYVGPEIYCRYYYVDNDGNRCFSKWTHFYSNLARPTGSSGTIIDDRENLYGTNQSDSGLSDAEFDDLENSGNSLADSDLVSNIVVPEFSGIESYTQGFVQTLVSLVDSMGQVPTLFSTVYSWLPSFVPLIIGIGLSSIVILRFLGR